MAEVYVEGVYQTTLNLYNPAVFDQMVLFEKRGMVNGTHTIKIVNTGNKNANASDYFLSNDAFEYWSKQRSRFPLAEILLRTYRGFQAAVLPAVADYKDMRRAVRESWSKVMEKMPGTDHDSGIVFIPQARPTIDGKPYLYVGLEVEEAASVPEELQILVVPEREYVHCRFVGKEEELWPTYVAIQRWITENGYESDAGEGVCGFERNDLRPVNPFDIPHD